MRKPNWEEGHLTLTPGQSLLCYPDGVPDEQNPQGEFFRLERVKVTACDHAAEDAEAIQRALLASVEDYCAGAARFDDITLLVIKRDTG